MSTESLADPSRAGASGTPLEGGPAAPAGPAAGAGASAAGPTPGAAPAATAHCSSCGAPLASDQRYCLECGERRVPMSSFLLGPAAGAAQAPASPPTAPPLAPALPADARRSSTLSVIAFVGVLLLAMGVGVLIGRAGNGKQTAPPAQVVTVDTPGSGSSEASFSGDWPAGTSGYTVQLQTLPTSGTTVSAVEAAKTSATAKGASAVGALKSEEFLTLPSGNYVVYSGVYHTRAAAQKALASLKKGFPAAAVIHVGESSGSGASGGSGSSGSGSSGSGSGGTGSSPTKAAPPTVLKNLEKTKGKSYEEQSKNLPNVVETG